MCFKHRHSKRHGYPQPALMHISRLDNGSKALIFKRPHHKEIEPILVEDLYAMIEGFDPPSKPRTI